MRRLGLVLATILTFFWTNPDTNQDGTPCTDLASIRIRGKRVSTGQNFDFWHPLCNEDGCLSGPGQPDSMKVNLPTRQGSDVWSFDAWAYDSTGNESFPSDPITIDIGNGAPITGVEITFPSAPKDEWYDVQGRRIDRPVASGVYFLRRGGTVRKVVVIK